MWQQFTQSRFVRKAAPTLTNNARSEEELWDFMSQDLETVITAENMRLTAFLKPKEKEEIASGAITLSGVMKRPPFYICTGDSGAPIYKVFQGNAYVVGILSFSASTTHGIVMPHVMPGNRTYCNSIGFARPVYPYLHWIKQQKTAM